ncbi:MAG TPA: FAD-dependent oxidoreductase, partial [Gammaproteobacteria bacterium]|nr:FAD-dependent oxidoreductase [Gammaproteobacteria bacterium]
MRTYDFIVIGGGSGGLAAAQRAAQYGARTLLFEPGRLGGTCVNVGCVPKKIMWTAAQLAHALHDARDYGFDGTIGRHDWPRLRQARDDYVAWLNGIYARNLERHDVELVRRRARLSAPGEIEDSIGEIYRAEHVLIATGGHPRIPKLPGADLGITSDGFFELGQCPRRVAVVGGGYVAVELAGVLQGLGAEVVQFVRFDAVLRSFDTLLSARLMELNAAAGIEIVTHAVPRSVKRAGGLCLSTEDGRQFDDFECLIWAVGRDPNVRDIGLEEIGVGLDSAGYVAVDK